MMVAVAVHQLCLCFGSQLIRGDKISDFLAGAEFRSSSSNQHAAIGSTTQTNPKHENITMFVISRKTNLFPYSAVFEAAKYSKIHRLSLTSYLEINLENQHQFTIIKSR